MSESVECFWLEPTSLQRVYLKKWGFSTCLAGYTRCFSKSPLCVVEIAEEPIASWPEDDIRWPQHCSQCGKAFGESAGTQLAHELLYKWSGTDILLTISEAPPGAMWDAWWLKKHYEPGPDGIHLVVRLPGMLDWQVDRPPSDEERKDGKDGDRIWTRTGYVPYVSVSPSVVSKFWSGRLSEGVLVPKEPDAEVVPVDLEEDDEDYDDED